VVAGRTRGYTLIDSDPRAGRLRLQTTIMRRAKRRPVEHAVFEVQFYREGRITVVPIGSFVQREGNAFRLPNDLAEEYVAFVRSIEEMAGR
jgi:hypothetical protein